MMKSEHKKLKIVFFGTPGFAATCLQYIVDSEHDVAAVVTVADKPSGRGQKIQESEVKKLAQQYDIPVYQPTNLKNQAFLDDIASLQADVFVVVAFRMMPESLFSIPPLGTFNLHASLLPDYRGAAPINYAIMNGEQETGVTTFFINNKIDEGHIILQEKTTIGTEETAGELHDRLMHLGGELIVKTLDLLAAGEVNTMPQTNDSPEKTAYKIFREDTRIQWAWPVEKIHNFIRGLSPYPAAFTEILMNKEKKVFKIYRGHFESKFQPAVSAPELIFDKKQLAILLPEGKYYPTDVQLQGKKRMPIKDFLNGLKPGDDLQLVDY